SSTIPPPLPRHSPTSPSSRATAVGEDDEADAVALLDGDVGECRGKGGGMVELAPVGAAVDAGLASDTGGLGEGSRAEGHGARRINEDKQVEVGLLLVLLQVELVGAAVDLPVEVADVVAGDVGAVLGELDAEA